MLNGTGALNRSTAGHQNSHRKAIARGIAAGAMLGCAILGAGWAILDRLEAPSVDIELVAVRPAEPASAALDGPAPIYIESDLIYSPRALGVVPKTFAQTRPIASTFRYAPPPRPVHEAVAPQQPVVRVVQSVVMPRPRPTELALPQIQGPSLRAPANRATTHRDRVLAALKAIDRPADKRSFFQKLFGRSEEPETALGYAAADDSELVNPKFARALTDDQSTAIYDISARAVYMPDGTKLEAHSGLGNRLDDPRHVDEKMRGATPPHVYELTLREALFHGVEAIRLTPVGGQEAIFNRTGLLAHTYMLGPHGDSNGCVSFRNYEAFLRAFKRNEVKRLVVVAKMT